MQVKELIAYLQELCNERPETANAKVVMWSYEDGGELVETDADRFEFVDRADNGQTLILPHVK